MNYEFRDGRLLLRREPEERAPILARLARIEGQVRGLRQMVEDDRYCGDELQQAAAIRAALREVALLIIGDHLQAGIEHAASIDRAGADAGRAGEAVDEMLALLRATLKQ